MAHFNESPMPDGAFQYRWKWELRSSPEALWPLVSDTNRFDRDAGLPEVHRLDGDAAAEVQARGRQLLRVRMFGTRIEWEENPFEWVRPERLGVVRNYRTGPLSELRVCIELHRRPGGGTQLNYGLSVTPRNLMGRLLIPIQAIVTRQKFGKVFREYDQRLNQAVPSAGPAVLPATSVEFAPGGRQRLEAACRAAIHDGASAAVIERLAAHIETADDMTLSKMRPYALADAWRMPRRAVLEACLRGTRAGLLELRWDVMCPLCRGTKQREASLSSMPSQVHCDACLIDFQINFDQLVELTFRPSPSIRPGSDVEYCVGGPQITPHIVVQQRLSPGETRNVTVRLEAGRYRIRARDVRGGQLAFGEQDGGVVDAAITVPGEGESWPHEEIHLRASAEDAEQDGCRIALANPTHREQLLIIERLAWTDQCTTAAEVIAMQLFRDLFADEALRPGEQVSVGSVSILFTDLRGSTRMYRAIGDAPAFGRVMNHFDVLRDAIAEQQGALVKTIGDAVMAVFPRPVLAVRAIQQAQQRLAQMPAPDHPLVLKAGVHYGPCIAVTLNGRLDYFGSTINLAARLQNLSAGQDLILSDAVRLDPEVAELLNGPASALEPLRTSLKGFDDEQFQLWRLACPPV